MKCRTCDNRSWSFPALQMSLLPVYLATGNSLLNLEFSILDISTLNISCGVMFVISCWFPEAVYVFLDFREK
jgi:hypothetical protein